MLQKLFIRNYAIIEEVVIDFSSNLNIITGETGAGKSILMGALNLILGERAESNTLKDKSAKCIVEGFFSANGNDEIISFLTENELDAENELVIRREILPTGKSRAFINDTPVSLAQLKKITSLLVDLHQQFDTVELGDNDFQREVLDALADNGKQLQQYTLAFAEYTQTKKELDALVKKQQEANAALDYHQFLFNELEEAGLKENELEELDAELKLLSNAENIKQQLGSVYAELKDGEQPINQQIKVLINKLQSYTQYHAAIDELTRRLQSSYLELVDISNELESITDGIDYSAERIQIVNDKIAAGYKLLKKHNVSTTGELLLIKEDLQKKLDEHLNISETIIKKEKLVKELLHHCEELAQDISANRTKAVKPFVAKVNALLKQVGMPNAQIKVQITEVPLHKYGMDETEFLFDANLPSAQSDKGGRFEPLRKVASGGELSRLMLCIKYLVAQKLHLPTLIFDEIDTGISGEAAKQVGLIMKELSASHQLISITHQPQIAAKADAHYFVYKSIKGDSIVTSVRLLNNEERVVTIAQMLSGEKPTQAALENAREMVQN